MNENTRLYDNSVRMTVAQMALGSDVRLYEQRRIVAEVNAKMAEDGYRPLHPVSVVWECRVTVEAVPA